MHFISLACIASILVLTFHCASAQDDQSQFYKYMRKAAKNCVPGTTVEHDTLECAVCTCVMEGVIKCDPSGCPASQMEVDNDKNPAIEAQREEVVTEDPELENTELEPTNGSADQLNDKADEVYKKLRDDATGCTPGVDVATDPCAGCTCILPGVMRCTLINCLLREGNEVSSKLCSGFGCYKPPGGRK